MPDYDGSIRIGTGIDTKGFDKDGKELETKAKGLGKALSNSAEIEVKVDASGTEKEFEKVFDDIEKEEKRIEELAKRAVERVRTQQETAVIFPHSEESRPFTAGYNQDVIKYVEEFSSKADESSKHFNFLKQNAEELSQKLKELQKEGKFFGDTDYDQIYVAWKNATDSIKDYRKELEKDTESGMAKAAEQEAKAAERREATQRKAEEQAERALQKENARIQKEIENQAKLEAKEEARRAKEIAAIQAQEAEERRLDQIRINAVASNDEIIAKVERIKQLEQEIADLKKVERTEGYADYDNRIKELSGLKREVSEYKNELTKVSEKFENMRTSAKKAFNAITEGTNKSSASLSGGLKTMIKYGLGIRSLYVLVNKLRTAIKEGFKNLAQYSSPVNESISMLMSSLTQLKNSLATAFAPILTAVAPALKSLIDMLSKAATYVGMLIAALTGAKTFTKAIAVQQDYAKSLKGTASAAKKAFGALARFDDLDVLSKQDDSGGIEADLSPQNMFEEVPVDTKVIGWLDELLARLDKLKNIFAQGFWDSLGDWEYRWESIKKSAVSIKDSLIDIFTDPAVISAGDTWAQSVAYMLGRIAGSMASIGLTIATNLVGGISKYLEGSKERIKKHLVAMFDIGKDINDILSGLSGVVSYVLEAFASENGQQLTANIIGIYADAFMGISELAFKFARDILNIFAQPFIENQEAFREALEGFLGVLAEVTGTIKQGIGETFDDLNEVYDEHLKPFFDSIANGLSNLTGLFLEFWNGNLKPILDEWAALFDTLWKTHLQPMFNNFIGLLGSLADFLKLIWESILQPIIWGIIEYVKYMLPYILNAVDTIVNVIFVAAGLMSDIIGGLVEILSGFIDFIVGVFTGDLEKACNGFIKIIEGVRDYIKGIINAILGFLETMVNSFIGGINDIIHTLNSLSSIKNPLTGEAIWSLDLPEFPQVSIPRLATGAVIRGGNPFMAILGDQPAGKTNIEAPADLIKDMVKQGIAESGYEQQQSVPVNINLNYDGETFARLSIPDILAELGRQGYDVDVLGVT